MGSIVSYCLSPQQWRILPGDYKLIDKYGGGQLLRCIVGEADYDYTGYEEIEIYIQKDIYDKLMSRELHVDDRGSALWGSKLVITDQGGTIVPWIHEDYII